MALPATRNRPADRVPRILHIAPEVCLMRKLRKHYDGHPGLYLTADLESPLADLHFDVQHIPSRTILRTW